MQDVSVVDLFCGAGGLTYGLERGGLPVDVGVDVDPDCRHAYEANTDARFVQADLETIADRNPERLARLFEPAVDTKVLAGCAPCQPFSPMNHGGDAKTHGKWGMLDVFADLVEYTDPDVVVMENVFEVRNHDVYEAFEETLRECGYTLNPDEDKTVYAPKFGVPQKRKRWVLLASKAGSIDLGPRPRTDQSEYPTARECINHLPALQSGETHPDDVLHTARDLSETNLERVRHSEPGGTWEDWVEAGREDLLLDCHKKDSGRTYKSVYGRMRPDEPAPTMTTQFYNYGSGRFGHYDTDQDRAISLREGAMLQSFPRDYEFVRDEDDLKITKMGELIGNAVPPKLAQHIGERVASHLDEQVRSVAAD